MLKASPAVSGRCVKRAPSWPGRRLRWWLRSSGYSSGIVPTSLLQSKSALNKNNSKQQKKKRRKSEELKYIPSPSMFSTSSYLWMNICLLFSVWAPIGFDRSRKVAGFERLRVYQGKKEIKAVHFNYSSPPKYECPRQRSQCVWSYLWLVVS